MSTLKEAVDVYYELSPSDQAAFFLILPGNSKAGEESKNIHALLTETRFSEGIRCARCGSLRVVKNGKRKDGVQRYLCRECGKSFLSTTNTVASCTHKRLSAWMKYFSCMMEKKTLRESSEACGISMGTAFTWRHKILDSLKKTAESVKLSGTVEADEAFFDVSYKGNHTADGFSMPRPARRRGGENHRKGLSEEKACVVCAISKKGTSVSGVAKTGKVSSLCVEKVFSDRIRKGSTLCTDNEKAYISYAKDHGMTLIQMDTDKRTKGKYGIQRINAYHSRLKAFLAGFRGVSTKHLNGYLSWYNLMFSGEKKEKEEVLSEIFQASITAISSTKYRDIANRPALPSVL